MVDKGGNSPAQARIVRPTEAGRVITDRVSPSDRNDFFQLRLARRSYLIVSLRNLRSNANLEIRDANNQLFRLPGPRGNLVLSRSRNPGKSSEIIAFPIVERGTYFIRVFTGRANTSYRLQVAAVPRSRFGDENPAAPVTQRFRDLNIDGDSNPSDLTVIDGNLFFVADDPTDGGRELYVTNGTPTAQGTRRVRDIVPGAGGSNPSDLVNVNGVLYFAATDEDGDRELYRSDGTLAGTVRVTDRINPGSGEGRSSDPTDLVSFNGVLYFAATDANGDRELYRSDGTSNGTLRVSDINLGNGQGDSSNPTDLVSFNGALYFAATGDLGDRELYRHDGTLDPQNTVRFSDINLGTGVDNSSNPTDLTIFNGALYFIADDGISGRELWRSDGSPDPAGTTLVSDINPTDSEGSFTNTRLPSPPFPPVEPPYSVEQESRPTRSRLVELNGFLYFAADDGTTSGIQLWRSDGTQERTERVTNINPGEAGFNPSDLAAVNGVLYFAADDGNENGREFYRSDGSLSATGTVLISDINPGEPSSDPAEFTLFGNQLFLVATNADSGRELRTLALTPPAPPN